MDESQQIFMDGGHEMRKRGEGKSCLTVPMAVSYKI
jgi:hypothetical protein